MEQHSRIEQGRERADGQLSAGQAAAAEAGEPAGRLSRRAALARLGLGAAAVYAAPTVTRIDQARASAPSHSCPPGAPGCGGGPPGRP